MEIVTEIMNYIAQDRLVLIPVLLVIGYAVKLSNIRDEFIIFILMIISVILSVAMGGNTIVNNVIQGILVTGGAVLGNQGYKQVIKIMAQQSE